MTETSESDFQKLSQVLQSIKKTIECTICHKLPTETEAGKCGHPFCKNCVEKVLNTRKAVCNICKTVIIRSTVRRVKNIDNIVKDLYSICEAVEKDTNTTFILDKRLAAKRLQEKRNSLTLPGPSVTKIENDDSSQSGFLCKMPIKQYTRKGSRTKKIERRVSIDSEETIKIPKNKLPKKSQELSLARKSQEMSLAVPSTSKLTDNNTSEPVFTDDNLSEKIGSIGYKEKVEEWLNAEEFIDKDEEGIFSENLKPCNPDSTPTSEILESFSQVLPNSGGNSKSRISSQASKANNKNTRNLRRSNSTDKSRKFPSFTFEATDQKIAKSTRTVRNLRRSSSTDNSGTFPSFTFEATDQKIAKSTKSRVRTSAEKIFDDLRRQSIDEQNDNKKSKDPVVSTDNSWRELKIFKKEANPKVKKLKKLNVSVERPSSTKLMSESLDLQGSEEEKEAEDSNSMKNGKNKSSELNEGTKVDKELFKQKKKPNVLSSRLLDQSEMIDIPNLNRRQLKEIIGVLDDSKNSSESPNKSSNKCDKSKLSLSRSAERSRNNTNDEESTSHIETSSRPQSKQSNHPNDSRPDSRLSLKSTGKPATEKFNLSMRKRSLTPNTGPSKISGSPAKEEEQEKIKLGNDSPVRVCNDFIRNRLSLKRLSLGNSKTTDPDYRGSTIVSHKKLGRLFKPPKIRTRIKFLYLGSTKSELRKKEEKVISTCNASTQTGHTLVNSGLISNDGKHMINESMDRVINASAASRDLRQIEEPQIKTANTSSKTIAPNESSKEFDTVTKVNMLSPDKDSQLKYLATKSPSVARIDFFNTNRKNRTGQSPRVLRESSFTNSSTVPSGFDEYSEAVKYKAEKLIVTDSEDQDTNENYCKIKRKNKHVVAKNGSDKAIISSTTSFISKTTSSLSDVRMDDKIETVTSRNVINAEKSPSVHSVRNNSIEKSSYASPKRKRYSRDSFGSQSKRSSTEKPESLSKRSGIYQEKSPHSEKKKIPLKKTESQDTVQSLEDSDASIIPTRHRVVRKLKYSQESKTESGKTEISDKTKSKMIAPKTLKRIRRIPSTDSENESLEISLTTRESSSNSQTITRPGPSRDLNKSPIPSEDMTVVFSSNKDTQESKRKRSPSPHSLDNNDLQAIASNWCADLDRSSEEIAVTNDNILGLNKDLSMDRAPLKKPRVEFQDSPTSPNSDNFPALSPTAIYGNKKKSNETMGSAMEVNQSSNNEDNALLNDLEEVAEQFDSFDGKISMGTNSIPKSNTRHISLVGNVECSIKRGNTFNGTVVTTSKNSSSLIKSKSLEERDTSGINKLSQNSDKENKVKRQGVKKRAEYKETLANTRQKISSNENLNEFQSSFKSHDKSEMENISKSNSKSVPGETNLTSNTELFDSPFDPDCLNITQEQLLMQEVEDNLLGRKSKQEKTAQISPMNNSKKTLKEKEPSVKNLNQMIKGYQIAQIDTDDSGTMDEDIIENTPEKNLPLKKDSNAYAENSQRFKNSFMSQDLTPIGKGVKKSLQMRTDGCLDRTSRSLSNNQSVLTNQNIHSLRHSTPKSATSTMNKLQSGYSTNTVENNKPKLCFVCSSMTLSQVQTVKFFAQQINAQCTSNYTPEVTHIIVDTNEHNSAARTLKYLFGVAHKKWIVSYRWVIDSLKEKKLLQEKDYEANDGYTKEPGPCRSRLSKTGLFNEFSFLCMEPFSDITIGQLQDLITSTDGTVVQSLEDLATDSHKYKMILYDCDIHESIVLDNWQKKGRALPVEVEWVLSCISQYKLVSFRYFIQNIDPEWLSDFDFPPELLAEKEEEEEEEDDYSMNQ